MRRPWLHYAALIAGLLGSFVGARIDAVETGRRPLVSRSYQAFLGLGTTIVIYMTASSVIVGADSRLHTETGLPLQETCKVQTLGNIAFANAGLVGDQYSGFSVSKVAAEAIRSSSSPDEAIQVFELRVSKFLEAFLPQIRHIAPGAYSSFEEKPGISVAFARVVEGRPVVHVRSFSSTSNHDGSVSIKILRQDCVQTCAGSYIGLGHFDQVYKYVAAHPTAWGRTVAEASTLTSNLLRLEAEANPAEVGPPFSVLMMDSAGAHWISPGACDGKVGNKGKRR